MKILVIAEHDNTNLNLSSSNAISAAKQLGENISVLVIGNDCDDVAESVARISGVREVLLASHEVYKDLLPENLVPTIAKLAADTSHVVAPATTFGKNLMPGVAALLDVSQISDVIEIKASDTFVRPIYAGNAIATVQSADQVKVLTVRTTAFCAFASSRHCRNNRLRYSHRAIKGFFRQRRALCLRASKSYSSIHCYLWWTRDAKRREFCTSRESR
jgi:electron transfer flavoprotein alpha subunit